MQRAVEAQDAQARVRVGQPEAFQVAVGLVFMQAEQGHAGLHAAPDQ
jgi:hypothetical protein